MYHYQLYGLTLLSELVFPEFREISQQPSEERDIAEVRPGDVIIRFGKIAPEGLPDAQVHHYCHQFNAHSFWLNINKVGRYLVESGNSITIDPVEGIDEASIRAFILEPCLGILLTQRELFILKGNTLSINGHNIAILGDYGSGKSSVSAAFLQKDHFLSSDGLCVMNQEYEILAGYPSVNLWFDTASYLNKDIQNSPKIRPNLNKFSLAIADNFMHKKQNINAIFILNLHKEEKFRAQSLLGSDKIMNLQKHIYNKKQVLTLNKNQHYFNFLIQLAKKIPITLINRPTRYFRIHELAEFIEKTGNLV